MSLPGLEQALFVAKWGDAEGDAIEVIAKALELPVAAVERVLFAAGVVKDRRNTKKFSQISETLFEGPTLDLELRKAIGHAVEAGLKRAAVRYVIQNDYKLFVWPSKLVKDNPRNICDGCSISIECMLTDASKPETCVKRGVLHEIRKRGDEIDESMRRSCPVTPIKLDGNKVTVVSDHPRGTWTLDLEDVQI